MMTLPAPVPPALRPFLDPEGRLTQYPAKRSRQLLALTYLATKFTPNHTYTEKEVNATLTEWHTFTNPALLRRDLFDNGHLDRNPDGSSYWLSPAAS